MNVGFDGIIFGLQRLGGISTYAWELLRRAADDDGVALTLGLPAALSSNRAAALAALAVTQARESLPVGLSRYLPHRLRQPVSHSTYYRSPLGGGKSVITAYDFVYERYRSGLARTVHSTQKRRACQAADIILCISENTRQDLLAACPAISPDRARVTPLAADTTAFYLPEGRRNDLQDHVVFVGQRAGYKRFDLAIAAVARSGLCLAIVGPDLTPDEQAILAAALPHRHRHLGRVTDPELRDIYAGAFAFLYPSDYEGFGLPILEAQACGCPAVVANRSSFPEVGGTAALYAAEQSAEAYATQLLSLADSATRAAVISAGLANAARFNWDRTYALTRAAWGDLA
ncbi:glycosyltransferase family 4 protein [Sandaracinobacteroides saxicola]|uniref:Glycosyltransferase family 4 protein n=1 Tax=Sandaracinobacteroides saxicola TaxID=2759707 RepID=A0A7G5IKM2_9SPHN|nr:glycosyltransferase family 1 protein [Sandaracinobacteroides saxicola]QMW23914.1 glycosyltransferase family 4 protein [Sandaracinobacteroides saxicola]